MLIFPTMQIGIVIGSLRKQSYSQKITHVLQQIASSQMQTTLIDITNLPLYNEDLETASPPPTWTRLRQDIRACDALLFVTPEYNRSIPSVLKNVLDIGSRPYGESVRGGKPGGVISFSPGPYGGFGAHHVLRQSLVVLNVFTMAQPEMYLSNIYDAFDTDDQPSPRLQERLTVFMKAYEQRMHICLPS